VGVFFAGVFFVGSGWGWGVFLHHLAAPDQKGHQIKPGLKTSSPRGSVSLIKKKKGGG